VTQQGWSQFVQGMDNLSSPDLCNNLHTGKIWCGPVRKGMPQDFHRNKQDDT
jgi:hypothetical protein